MSYEINNNFNISDNNNNNISNNKMDIFDNMALLEKIKVVSWPE